MKLHNGSQVAEPRRAVMMRRIIGLAIAGATLNGVAAGVETSLEAVTNVVCEWRGEELRDWRWRDYAAEFAASPRQRIFFEP